MLCPIQKGCLAFEKGKQTELPIMGKEKTKLPIKLKFFFLEKDERILVVKYKHRRFFKTIFTLPFLIEGKNLPTSYEDNSEFGKYLREKDTDADWLKTGKHSITHHDIELQQARFLLDKKNLQTLEKILSSKIPSLEIELKWIKKDDLKSEFASSIAGKLIAAESQRHSGRL